MMRVMETKKLIEVEVEVERVLRAPFVRWKRAGTMCIE